MRRAALPLTLVALLLLAGSALAMASDNFRLDWFSPLTGSGGPANSSHYAAHVTVGQAAVGATSGGNRSACLGYWCAGDRHDVFVPLVIRDW